MINRTYTIYYQNDWCETRTWLRIIPNGLLQKIKSIELNIYDRLAFFEKQRVYFTIYKHLTNFFSPDDSFFFHSKRNKMRRLLVFSYKLSTIIERGHIGKCSQLINIGFSINGEWMLLKSSELCLLTTKFIICFRKFVRKI